MSPEAQRIAIAEACGFSEIRLRGWSGVIDGTRRSIPDYLDGLNAVNEAEKTLTCDNHGTYAYWIQMVTAFKHNDSPLVCIGATATQRAEAFLRTIGKWEDA